MKRIALLVGLIGLFSTGAGAQGVQGVFPGYNWQAYIGYTYVRFFEVPNTTVNSNGFNCSMTYFHNGGWFGGDGEFVAAFGSQSNRTSALLLGMGGARVRWSESRRLNLWAHALAGGSHLTPRTPYGSEAALGYELGGGVDLNTHYERLAYRIQADAVGTRYFGTYQFSPKISVGVVYKF